MKNAGWLRLAFTIATASGLLLGAAVPAMSGGESQKLPRSGLILDVVPAWQPSTLAEAVDTQVADEVESPPGGERIKTKSPLAAFLLGSIVGFGSGQFYSGKRTSGFFFLGADIVLSGVIIGGIAAFHGQEDRGCFFQGGLDELLISSCALCVLAGSHAIQAVWGAYSAAEFNKSVSLMHTHSPGALNSRESDALAIRLSWRF